MVDALAGEDVRLDEIDQAAQQDGAVPDIVGKRRHADAHAFGGIGLALAVERLMQAKLVEQDHRQQVGASGCTRNGVEGRWRLRDGLTGLADELLTDRLHDDPLAGNDLTAFRDGLANFLEIRTVAAWAALWRMYDDAVAGDIDKVRDDAARKRKGNGGSQQASYSVSAGLPTLRCGLKCLTAEPS